MKISAAAMAIGSFVPMLRAWSAILDKAKTPRGRRVSTSRRRGWRPRCTRWPSRFSWPAITPATAPRGSWGVSRPMPPTTK